jgi:phosphoribosyl-ATP pyrophosphohydrolase
MSTAPPPEGARTAAEGEGRLSTARPPEGARTAAEGEGRQLSTDAPQRPMEDALARLAAIIESRLPAQGGDPEKSYVARLLHRGPDAFLKKIGEEATEVVMAAKDADHGGERTKIVNEVADLWFHSMVALAHYGFSPRDVVAELERREGTSGIEEKALRKAKDREASND